MKRKIRSLVDRLMGMLRSEPNIPALQRMGLRVGQNFRMLPQCRIDYSHCWHITIGDNVTFAPRVHILAHDASTWTHLGYTKVANVCIGNNVFIGAGSIVLPGVSIGDDCIIGAGSIVHRSIPAGSLATGNPAKVVMTTADYLRRQQARMTAGNCFDESFTVHQHINQRQKEQLLRTLETTQMIFVK